MAKFEMFDSLEGMFAALEVSRTTADAQIRPWQRALSVGDCVLRYDSDMDLFIWGRLRDPVADDRECGADEDEVAYTQELYASPHMAGFRAGRHFSVVVPDGELGDIHVSTVICKISQAQFDAARAAGWPPNGPNVLTILRMDETVPPRHVTFPSVFTAPS